MLLIYFDILVIIEPCNIKLVYDGTVSQIINHLQGPIMTGIDTGNRQSIITSFACLIILFKSGIAADKH